MKRKPVTHDYTKRGWGHDYVYHPIDGGLKGTLMGWGEGIVKGDYILLQNGKDSTRYRFTEISYYRDPRDMWSGKIKFAPRTAPTPK